MPNKPQNRNISGQALTALGRVDKREHNFDSVRRYPYQVFTIRYSPHAKVPWSVWATEVDTGRDQRLSQHHRWETAERARELHKLSQPTYTQLIKQKHKLLVKPACAKKKG